MSRSLVVLPSSDAFRVLVPHAGETLFESPSASEAVQRAIDTSEGGGVTLECGVYPLDRPVELDHQARLTGKGRGTRLVVTPDNGDGVGLTGTGRDGASVDNLSLVAGHGDAAIGIRLEGCGDCRVRDVFVVGFRDYGIVLREHCFLCDLRGCQLADNGKAGIFLSHHMKGRVGDYVQNSISDCLVYGGGDGVRCERTTVLNLTGCSIFQARGAGFRLIGSNSVLISGCRTFQITGNAVFAEKAHELNVTGNIFCWHTQDGLRVDGCRWGVLSGNEVIDTGSHNPETPDQTVRFDELPPIEGKVGIRLEDTRGFTVTGNTVFNWPQGCRMRAGLAEDAASGHNLLSGNNVNYFSEADAVSEGSGSVLKDTVSLGPDPHHSTADFPWIQSFEPHRVKAFVDAQRRRLLA